MLAKSMKPIYGSKNLLVAVVLSGSKISAIGAPNTSFSYNLCIASLTLSPALNSKTLQQNEKKKKKKDIEICISFSIYLIQWNWKKIVTFYSIPGEFLMPGIELMGM
jgi:hypothetical protein